MNKEKQTNRQLQIDVDDERRLKDIGVDAVCETDTPTGWHGPLPDALVATFGRATLCSSDETLRKQMFGFCITLIYVNKK